jgi:hypothetical protein
MKLRTIINKKSIKIITLLALSLVVAAASAQVYSYMYINGSASITTGGLSWTLGTSAPSGAAVNGFTVNDLNFSVPENTFQNFTDSLEIVNNDASTSHTFDLSTTITSGDAGDFTMFNMVVYNAAGDNLGTIDITTAGSATGIAIAGGATLYVRFEIQPVTDVSSGDLDFTIQLTYV